jgi:predicted dehydrogenase
MIMKEVRWGMIGCGSVTEKKSGPAFNKIKGSSLIATMRRDGEKAKDYASRHGIPKWYDDVDKLINDPDVNAIYVATPPLSHKEYTIKALEAGKPVYVEKPMAANYEDCLEMNLAAEKVGLSLYVAYYRRSLPYFLKVKDLIESGKIGDVRIIQLKLFLSPRQEDYNRDNPPWRVIPEIAGGGYFYDMACHQLDFLYYLFGQVKTIQSCVENFAGLYEAEDTVSANLVFENGIILNGIWSFTVSEKSHEDKIDIIGEKGRIILSTFARSPIVIYAEKVKATYNIAHPVNIQIHLIQSVVDALLGKGECPSTGKTGAYTNWLMDKMLKKI